MCPREYPKAFQAGKINKGSGRVKENPGRMVPVSVLVVAEDHYYLLCLCEEVVTGAQPEYHISKRELTGKSYNSWKRARYPATRRETCKQNKDSNQFPFSVTCSCLLLARSNKKLEDKHDAGCRGYKTRCKGGKWT